MSELKTYFNNITFYINFGNHQCDRYRVFNIMEALTKKGINCNLLSLLSSREEIENVLNKTDIIILFRSEFNNKVAEILSQCKERGIPTVFDIDDLLFEPELLKEDLKEVWALHVERLTKSFELCDFFTGSTQTLVERAKKYNKKAFIIKNTINYSQYKLAEKLLLQKDFSDEKIKIGYFSGSIFHDKDFRQCQKALLNVLEQYKNTELHIVGLLNLDKEFDKYAGRIKRAPLINYLEMLEYLSEIDINIAPLTFNIFNNAKSELKIFEAGLVKTPTIASATDSYKNCITDGINGLLVSSEDEWYEKLSLLIKDKDLRKNIAINARKDFIEEFYIENYVHKIINVYNSIILEYKNDAVTSKICKNSNLEYTQNPEGFSNILNDYLNTPEFKNKIELFIENHKDRKICFWGASLFFEKLLSMFDFSGLNIAGIIDKNPQKRLSQLGGITIFSPEDIENLNPDKIIIALERPFAIETGVKTFIKTNNLNNIEIDDLINILFIQNY